MGHLRPRLLSIVLPLIVAAFTPSAKGQSHAEILGANGGLENAANRRAAVASMQALEAQRRDEAMQRAALRGWPRRVVLPDGTVRELMGLDGQQPVYFTTHNASAAISTGANLLQAAPFDLTGAAVTVGQWDGGSARATHLEFAGRAAALDGAAADNHATHVAGTIAASGLQLSAKGMAPAARIDSYDFNGDRSEMTSRGAAYPEEPGKIYLSNHSYGYIAGWNRTGLASPAWDWWGSGTAANGVEDDFGKYQTFARDADALAASLPYYLMFRSAGNERIDNPPAGAAVALSPNGTTVVTYDPASHPAGDSVYKSGGYDTISFDAVAKNVITVGSVGDAVSGDTRSLAGATMASYSSWGPTDDGRIKPDVVANGEGVYSALGGSDSAYGFLSGTSMSTPNATGSAALLVNYFGQLFAGHAMRSSTLKGLLIHTADDLGTPGPDYQTGWGLINVKAAADLLADYQANPGTARICEDRVTTSRAVVTRSFTWDGVSPIRATLCWTDPAGAATNNSESRTARLVNNLNLQIVGPGGTVHSPYVMPYVGDWTAAKLSAPAVTGVNNTDNIEQVFIATPPVAGVYEARVTFSGTLTNSAQHFSLLISGGSGAAAAPAPVLGSISPASASNGTVTLAATGGNFALGATVKLTRSGSSDVIAGGIELAGDTLRARFNANGMAPGSWNVLVTNPDGQSAALAGAFTILGTAWAENFETGAAGWTHSAPTGADIWTLTTAKSNSPTHSYFAPGPATRAEAILVSPQIAVPSNAAAGLQLSFWHNYNFQNGADGGLVELSIDGGAYFGVTDSGSGAAFASGGYNSVLSNTGPPSGRNPLGGKSAWSGNSNGWKQVAITFTDAAKYAGKNLRLRWRLGTNSGAASEGWHLDDIVLTGATPANLPPSIVTPAAANPLVVTGTTVDLSVTATDDAGEAGLTYTWSVNDDFAAPIAFDENGTNAAKATSATFSKAGLFTFTVTARDAEGLTATSSVEVQVNQNLTAIEVSPPAATIGAGDSQQFTAAAFDQFGREFVTPPAVMWAVNGGGTVNASGLFTAGAAPGGPFTLAASSGGVEGGATLTITGETYGTWELAHFDAGEIASGLSGETADPDVDGLPNVIEYALGFHPREPSPILAATIVPDALGELRLTLEFTRPLALPGINYIVETSGDLEHWDAIVPLEITAAATSETVIARDPVPADEAFRRFIRLRISRANP